MPPPCIVVTKCLNLYECSAMGGNHSSRSTKAKSPKAKPASRAKGLITAANLAGIGSIETFTIIRELHDRLAQQGKDVKPEARSAMAKAAPMETAAAAVDLNTPWVTVARRRVLDSKRLSRSVPQQSSHLGISQDHRPTDHADETSWCSALSIGHTMKQVLASPAPIMPQPVRWLSYGQALGNPRPGCIVILWRDRLARGKAM